MLRQLVVVQFQHQVLSGTYNIDISGTAYRSVGAALSITVQNQTDNQNQYVLFAKHTNTDASAFVNPGGLTYNPGQNYLGINTSLPEFELDVLGDIRASGIVVQMFLLQTLQLLVHLKD